GGSFMVEINYLQAITKAMDDELARDENVFIFGEDVGAKGGVFRATDNLYDKYGEKRVIDAPLAESGIVGVAIGAAMYGLRPIAEIQFVDFILPAVNQIISEAAKIRYRSNNDWNCPITIRAPFGGGVNGALYHSQSLEAVFSNQPGLKVVIPSSPNDANGIVEASIRDNDTVLVFEHKRAYRLLSEEVPEEDYIIPTGKGMIKNTGIGVTVITYGLCVYQTLQVIKKLEKENISVHLLDLITVYPLDKESIIKAANKTGKILLITKDNLEGSIMNEVTRI